MRPALQRAGRPGIPRPSVDRDSSAVEYDVLIPARYAASRLPGKPLVDILGKPLIQWVHTAAKASAARRVVVATDDERILRAVSSFGGEVCMTRSDHRSGSDRVAEAAEHLGLAADRIVVNVQGDEPLIPGRMIDEVARVLAADAEVVMSTACHAVESEDELRDPNVVKVVRDARGRALYFSRAPIPWPRDGFNAAPGRALRHVGIYGYRAGFLKAYTGWPQGELERVEQLEQLRVLERGVPIAVYESPDPPGPGIDTPEDLARFRESMTAG